MIDVVRFYNKGGEANRHLDPQMKPLGLTDAEMNDLVQFLRTLTSDDRLVSLCVSEAIITEYEGVLARRKFSIDKEQVNLSMDLIRDVAVLVSPTERV